MKMSRYWIICNILHINNYVKSNAWITGIVVEAAPQQTGETTRETVAAACQSLVKQINHEDLSMTINIGDARAGIT